MRRVVLLAGLLVLTTLAGCSSQTDQADDGGSQVVVVDDGSGGTIKTKQGTGVVAGTVRTAAGFGLPNAHVAISGAAVDAATNKTGGFQIVDVPPGIRLLSVHYEGYHPGEASLDVKADKAIQVTVTLVPVGSSPNYLPHAHNFWAGSDTYTIFDGELRFAEDVAGVHPACTGYLLQDDSCRRFMRILPEDRVIVPPGTAKITFDLTITSQFFDQEEYSLYVFAPPIVTGKISPPYEFIYEYYAVQQPSQSFDFVLDRPELADHGHARSTEWQFAIIQYPPVRGIDAYDAIAREPIQVTVVAHKGAIALDPPHPKFWEERANLTMPSLEDFRIDSYPYSPGSRTPNPESCPWGGSGVCRFRLGFAPGGIVPPGTTRIEFDFEHWYGPMCDAIDTDCEVLRGILERDDFVLGYKTAAVQRGQATWDDYEWIEPVGTYAPASATNRYAVEGRHYSITVAQDEGDDYYARWSHWIFTVAVRGHENARTWGDIQCDTFECGSAHFEVKNIVVFNDDLNSNGAST